MKHVCTKCGNKDEINPAQLLASQPRKRSAEAVEQSRQAAKQPRPNAKGKKKPRKTPVSIVKEHLETVTSS